jgi:hypothetical protein
LAAEEFQHLARSHRPNETDESVQVEWDAELGLLHASAELRAEIAA